MSKALTKRVIQDNPDAAVFARNHWIYLESAVKRGRKGLTCFRATSKWKSAKVAIDYHGPRSIYFTPIDPPETIDNSLITHEAILLDALLLDDLETHQNTLEKNREVQRFYKDVLEETRDEGLWDGNVNTLYLVIGCRKLNRPFPYTKLIKIGDGMPISEDFGYSYSMCYERKVDCLG